MNTQAWYNVALITSLEGFIAQVRGKWKKANTFKVW
jgi:hypothetical protein